MFTPDNPFTAAISTNLTGVGADVAGLGGEVGGGVFKQDFTGEAASEVIPDVKTDVKTDVKAEVKPDVPVAPTDVGSGVKADGFMDGLKKAFTPGDDDYGFGDFWDQYLSPGRESVSAAAQDGYKKELANFDKLYGKTADASQYTNFIQGLDKKYAPGILDKFGPAVGTALAGSLASDTILGTNIITPPEVEGVDLEELQNKKPSTRVIVKEIKVDKKGRKL